MRARITPVIVLALSTFAQSAPQSFSEALVDAAVERTKRAVLYNGSYFSIEYPGGDIPDYLGVCTDVVVRSYRKLGIDLQELVHLDMKSSFEEYPKIWGLSRPDPNIDHRRVPNLQVFFSRYGEILPVTDHAKDYKPGELVTWMLPGNLPHIGIVVEQTTSDGSRHLLVHNVGRGPKLEDVLFDYKITGHFRYTGPTTLSDAR